MMKTKEMLKVEMRAGLTALTKRMERKHEPCVTQGDAFPHAGGVLCGA